MMSTPQTESTLHDFTLNLLSDPTARLAFQQDPEGVLSDAGLSGITPGDVYEILPLVLDSASIIKVDAVDKILVEAGDISAADQLKLITNNLNDFAPVTDVVGASGITAVVKDFSDVGDVSSTLDAAVIKGNDVVTTVTDVAYDNTVVGKVNEVVDVDVEDITSKISVVGNDVDALTGDIDIENTVKAVDVVNVGDTVVQDVAQVGDVQGDLIGDITVGDVANNLLKDGIGNGNDVDLHF